MTARIAHSGRAGEIAQNVAEAQLELARARLAAYFAIERRYYREAQFRARCDRLAPELTRSIRNGRLHTALFERFSVWLGEAL